MSQPKAITLAIISATAVLTQLLPPLYATTPAVTVAEVQAMQARIPDCERCTHVSGAYAHAGDAKAVAQAIAHVAPSHTDAALMAVYAAWESGNVLRARGDAGQARGAWQLHADPAIADNPVRAAAYWLDLARRSSELCADLPEREQLAALGSGSCQRGREKARRRADVARDVRW